MRKLIFTNTLYQILSRVTTAFSFFIVTILITKYLGAEFYGKYSIVITFVYVYFVLSEFGMQSYLVKEYSKDKELAKKTFTSVVLFKATYGLLLATVATVILFFMPYSLDIKKAALIVIPAIVFKTINDSSLSIMQSYLQYSKQLISVIAGSVLGVILCWVFLEKFGESLDIQILAYTIAYGVMAILSLFFVKEYLNLKRLDIDFKFIKIMLKEASFFGFSILVNFLMINADRLIMTFYSTYHSIGVYSLAYRIFELILVLPAFFMNTIYPILSKLQSTNQQNYFLKLRKVLNYLIFAAFIFVLGTLTFSWFIIPKVFGDSLKDSYVALNILILGVPFFFITAPLSWLMVLEKKQKNLFIINLLVLMFNVTTCLYFIPLYDYKAAAWITGLSEFIILIALIYSLRIDLSKVYKS